MRIAIDVLFVYCYNICGIVLKTKFDLIVVDLFQVHFYTERDLEKIYGAVPKQCLPEDYGGLAQSSEKTHGTHNSIQCYLYLYNIT